MLASGLFLLSLSANSILPVADAVPRFDITASCGSADKPATGIGRPIEACRNDEEKARNALETRWSGYSVSARRTCTESAEVGGPPSYVELITCLEMAKQQ